MNRHNPSIKLLIPGFLLGDNRELTNELQDVELLPANGNGDHPDGNGSHTVKHHPELWHIIVNAQHY
jgi:hypothetical protein